MLVARGLGMRFAGPAGEISLFQNLDLTIADGEAVAVLGASGSGKSTLLGLLAGLDVPTEGQVFFNGNELTAMDEDQRARLRAGRVGFVFQAFHLMPGLTALENVMLPLELSGSRDPRGEAVQALEAVGLGERLTHYPPQLSGGEQQRVAIGRAFVTRPRLLFADEPTGNLDQGTGERIIDLLFQLNREHGTTLVLVTHDPALARRCDRVLHIADGALEAAA
ncbi:ABC transporter ATP-binding protein [Ectothiorhodospiraceae bacterium WFHF3C12]|nr:ABC transporter ATP-binding protein [Ectothiorhodospiraceae bacterium WFHF3C12]